MAGSLLGILYNYALIAGLNTVWNDIVRTDMLHGACQCRKPAFRDCYQHCYRCITCLPGYPKKMKQPVAGQLKGYTVIQSGGTPEKKQISCMGICTAGAFLLPRIVFLCCCCH